MNSKTSFADQIGDRMAIADVMYRWCRAVDRKDWDAVDDCFHPEATDNHGIYNGDIPGMKAWLMERHESIVGSSHYISNMLIEFVSPERAVVESYALAYQRYPAAPDSDKTRSDITGGAASESSGDFDMLINGRYVDLFEKRDGEWRVLERTVIFDTSMMLPVPAGGAQLDPSWPIGRRDATDPLWRVRKEAGL